MSGLSIRSGGAIDVDTASLRAVASSMADIALEAEEVARLCRDVATSLGALGVEAMSAYAEASLVSATTGRAAADATRLVDALRSAADLYDAVEALAARELAEAAGDAESVARLDRLLDDVPWWTRGLARHELHQVGDRRELERQVFWGSQAAGPVGADVIQLMLLATGIAVDRFGRGRVGSADRLGGAPPPVTVRPVAAPVAGVAPATFADAAARIPGGGESRVRVERYAMPLGRAQFVVYVAGTQSGGDDEAFDMASNLELYGGERSASYEAVLQALEDAGARPGDAVHAFGHSQGAMITERLAVEGPYDVRTAGSFGSPVQAEVGADTLSVTVRHTDDPVAALQTGGYAGQVGSSDSLVVERVADPQAGLRDLGIPAHAMESYVETAAMIDASTDPRVEALRAVWDDLGAAEEVTVSEYSSARVSRSSSGGG